MILVKDAKVSFDSQIALNIKTLAIGRGAKIAVTGESGSGKSTLLHILCGLERIDEGEVRWDEVVISDLGELKRDRFRGEKIGLIAQDFYLYYGLSAIENALLPASFRFWRVPKSLKARALYLLERLGVKADQSAHTLSRGEKQRTAIARALLCKPQAIIADEPTASLDASAATEAIDALLELCEENGCTLICATHDKKLIARMGRTLELKKGEAIEALFPC